MHFSSAVTNLVQKNLKLKYKQSILGFLWSLITPLVYLVIFNFVFSQAFLSIENYSLYVLVGLVFWQFFSNATNQTIQSFVANGGIIKTLNVPIQVFPIASIWTELVSLLLTFIPFLILMVSFGLTFTWHFVLLFPAIVLFALASYGLGTLLGVLNVYLRDVSILWSTINPALFYLTPIAYDDSIVPASYLVYIKANPLYHYFDLFRDILYRNEIPSAADWLTTGGISIVILFIGMFSLKKLEKGIISNI